MSKIFVKKERVINAAPANVYAVLSDYKSQRPQMLTPNFLNYTVEKGGKGDGTVISYRLRAANRERPYEMRVNEPVKGEVITESDSGSSLVTTWALSPLNNGQQTKVRVSSEWEGGTGVRGFFERTFAPLGLRGIYGNMLDSLLTLTGASATTVTAVQGEEGSPVSNAAGFLLIFAIVVGIAYGISLLRKNQR
jgi:hypothetical protein